jgi:anti-sigma B factor antagonist
MSEIDHAAAAADGQIVVDMRELSFVDSSGLRAILAANERLVSQGLDMRFLKPPSQVWRVFAVTGTDRLLRFDEELESVIGPVAHQERA